MGEPTAADRASAPCADAPKPAVSAGLPPRAWRVAIAAAFLGVAIAAGFALKGFVLFQLTQAMIFAIAILGLDLLTGINGQVSLGHSAFMALGAYTAALLVERLGVPAGLAAPAAGVVCFLAGFAFGLPALRLEGIYLALATFALAAATPQILKLSVLAPWTGGVQGLVVSRPHAPFGAPLSTDQWLYGLTLAVGLVLYALARNLVDSRAGRALRAIRDNPIAAQAMGVDIALYKASAFGVSAFYTGVAGALGALVVGFVAPDSFPLSLSIGLLVGMVVGGVGWLPGALVGGMFLLFAPNIAEQVSQGLSGAVYGALLLLVIYLMPSGAGGLAQKIGRWMRRIVISRS